MVLLAGTMMYLLNSFFAVLVSGNWLISVPSWIEIEVRTGSLSVLSCVKLCSIIGILDLERGGIKNGNIVICRWF